jgi:hypothetical protein
MTQVFSRKTPANRKKEKVMTHQIIPHRIFAGNDCEEMVRDMMTDFDGDILLLNGNGNWPIWVKNLNTVAAYDPVGWLTDRINRDRQDKKVLVCAQPPLNGQVKRMAEIVAQTGRKTGRTLLLLATDSQAAEIPKIIRDNAVAVVCRQEVE